MKGDLHVHSRFSTRPSQWILQKIGCPESFTQPKDIYRIAKNKGMDIVTITDHNTIAGAEEIAHLPGVFVSEEITTYFPEDRCKVHVLAFNISSSQHEDIQKIRQNIYDLVVYLRQQKIVHVVAHPLFSINGRLTIEHFEKMLLLFSGFELNGSRNDHQNQVLRALIPNITSKSLKRLAEKHDNIPVSLDFGRKWLISGSDDHSSFNIGRYWTSVPDASDVPSFLKGLLEGKALTDGTPSTPLTMAHNLYGIAYQYYRERFQIAKHVHKDILLQFLERVLDLNRESIPKPWSSRFYNVARSMHLWPRQDPPEKELPPIKAIWKMSQTLLAQDRQLLTVVAGNKKLSETAAEKAWSRFLERASNALLVHLFTQISHQWNNANVFDIFGTLGSAGALYTLMAPYFAAFSYFTKDKIISREVARHFDVSNVTIPMDNKLSVAHFSDTLLQVNGVAKTLLQQLRVARSLGKQLVLITSEDAEEEIPSGVVNFKPIGRYTIPEYPELSLNIPPFLQLLSYCYEQNFTQIHVATPGPMGLAALAVARILSIPIVATYHTALPEYVFRLTEDEVLESITRRYIMWFYNQMDRVYVPSSATARELINQGLPQDKILIYPRGVDIRRFSPEKYSPRFRLQHQLDGKAAALYVGRLSKEKDLDILCRAFRRLHEKEPKTALVIVGDGPYRSEMEKMLSGTHAVFTGYLTGDALYEAYASCDFFVFPSTTDTFGNVVLEAQASGLPVIVSDRGGPQENIIPGRTGWIFPGRDEDSLLQIMEKMCLDVSIRSQMGKEARKNAEGRAFEAAFQATWQLYAEPFDKKEEQFSEAV
ncbi:MAG: glycosyltransferase [Thermodesulforhabdaceae bacterium]